MEVRSFGFNIAFNARPLRQAVREHIKDLERCMVGIAESNFAAEFDATRKEIGVAAKDLSDALIRDEGVPKIGE